MTPAPGSTPLQPHAPLLGAPLGYYAYLVRFANADGEATIAYDARTPTEVAKAWREARKAAFAGGRNKQDEAQGVFELASGAWLVTAVESVSLAGPSELSQLNEQNSMTALRSAQAEAIARGDVAPDNVGRQGEVVPYPEQGHTDEDDDDDGDDDDTPDVPAPQGFAALAGK